MTILDDIFEKRKEQLEKEKANYAVSSFKQALKKPGLSIIGEIKRASPSKGRIASETFNLEAHVAFYQEKGIDAYSVLTEESYFKGQNADLVAVHKCDPKTPLLRKDFIFDHHQVFEAKVIGASAILLIVKMLSLDVLIELHTFAQKLGLDVLVEVHDVEELKQALQIPGLEIIGINNRNLNTFETNLQTTVDVLKELPNRDNYVIVSESGYLNHTDVEWAKTIGADALLIGEGLMKGLI